MTLLRRFLPGWLAAYPRQKLGADLAAGLIVTVLVIPQSLAYALLAGLPPQMGLYVSIFPVIAYALLGSSMVQAVGPVAITAIMTYAVLSPLAAPGSAEYILLAAVLSLFSGLMLLTCGVLRLGFLSQLLSRPVISGFISGSAVLIIISQMKYLLGIAPQGRSSAELVVDLLSKLADSHGPTVLIGLLALAALAFARHGLGGLLGRLGLGAPRAAFIGRLMPLVVVLFGTLAVVWLDLDRTRGVAVVGSVVAAIPGFEFFLPRYESIKLLIVPAFVMTLIGMVQGITMAQALAIKRRERVDANAELVGLGAANVVAAFYGGMPVGGGTVAFGDQCRGRGADAAGQPGVGAGDDRCAGRRGALVRTPAARRAGGQHHDGRLVDDRSPGAAPSLGLRPGRRHGLAVARRAACCCSVWKPVSVWASCCRWRPCSTG